MIMYNVWKFSGINRLFILAVCLFVVMGLYAGPRSVQEAQQIANAFAGNTGRLKKGINAPVRLAYTRSGATQPLYYVFNKGAGFVIVSADDRAPEILGYSDAGPFDIDSLPDNFRFLLGSYAAELEALASAPELIAWPGTTAEASTTTGGKSVAPLLGSILWDQGDPYNALCPELEDGTKTVVGCVATAMAQIMGYHRWPEKGTGTIPAYTTRTNGLEMPAVNIEDTYYDWAHITPFYTAGSTPEEREAIAPLMYHCGLSMEMDYGYESGAYSIYVPRAFITYFDYNENMECLNRDFYTKAEWDSIIRHELDESRPVYYSGSSEQGGHAFVCDGYDANGLFHINWGWSGMSNGYFVLSDLTPASQGIGGSRSGYNRQQIAVVGIQPQNSPEREEYQILLDTTMIASQEEVGRNDYFTVEFHGLWNRGVKTFSGDIAAVLCDRESGEVVEVLTSHEVTFESMYGWEEDSYKMTIPGSVPEGIYHLCLAYRVAGKTDCHVIRTVVGKPNYLSVIVSDDRVYVSSPMVEEVDLQQDAFEVMGNLYTGCEGKFRYTVTNHGGEYVSGLFLLWQSADDASQTVIGTINPVVIASGETLTFEVSETVPVEPGEYNVVLMCDYYNSYDHITWVQSVGDVLRVTVHEAPVGGTPDLQMLSPLSVVVENRADVHITGHIVNKGDYFNGNMIAFIFPESENNSIAYAGFQVISLDAQEELEINIDGAISLEDGTYVVGLFYWGESGWTQLTPYGDSYAYFTLGIPTGVEVAEATGLTVYPNPAGEVLHVRPDGELLGLAVYDLSGRELLRLAPGSDEVIQVPVAHLQPGTYMLRVHTTRQVETTQFIKK